MRRISYSEEKNLLLLKERGVSFPDVIAIIAKQGYLAIVDHPKKQHQRLIIFDWKGYVYYAPFVTEVDGSWFLKTIIPSRKLTKRFSGRTENDKEN